MSKQNVSAISPGSTSVLATNKVLRNTYVLLGMTFLFSALMAFVSVASGVKHIKPLLLIVGAYGLMF